MKAQRRLGLSFSWPRVTAALVVDVAVLAAAGKWPRDWDSHDFVWWFAVAIAVLVALIAVLSYQGVSLPGALARWLWDWSADPESKLTMGCTAPITHQRRFSKDVIGLREYHGRLVSVIAMEGPAGSPSGRHHHRDAEGAPLPIDVVATALRQFDVRLDSIDIVSVGRRRDSAAAAPGSRAPLATGDAEATDERRTWLVLRMDPQHNVAAVATRDSLASTFAAVTERLTEALDGRNCAARPLTGDELAEVDQAVLAGLQPTWSRPGWRHLKHFNGYATSFWVSPQDINSEALSALWSADTDATVLTIRVSPRLGGAEVSAWVRYHSPARLPRDVSAGLNRLIGRQLAAVRASLPAPMARSPLVVPARLLAERETLALPVSSAAQRAVQ